MLSSQSVGFCNPRVDLHRLDVVARAQRLVADLIDLHVVLPAQRQAAPTDVRHLRSVVAHADAVHVVQLRALSAHAALFAQQAGVDIALQVVAQRHERLVRRDVERQAKVNQIADKLARRRHVAVRKAEQLLLQRLHVLLHELVLERQFGFLRRIPCIGGDFAHQRIGLSTLIRCDGSRIWKADLDAVVLPDAKPADIVVGHKRREAVLLNVDDLSAHDLHQAVSPAFHAL